MGVYLNNLWLLVVEASPWLLIGLIAAGVIRAFVPDRLIARLLGRKGIGSIFAAAILGVPLPLCSCSVLPVAIGIRRQGASRGATTSFLISTPENGADSIALSYILLGPFMAIVRPVASIVSAVSAGVLVEAMAGDEPDATPEQEAHCVHCHEHPSDVTASAFFPRLIGGIRYALTTLYADLVLWLAIGLLLAALMQTLIPPDALQRWGSGPVPMIAMLFVGIPIYICATASTPVAAAMLLAGVSPGTVLVFLLAGPATNIATVMVVRRELGSRAVAIYLATLGITTVLMGLATDALVERWGIDIAAQMTHGRHLIPEWLAVGCAVALIVLGAGEHPTSSSKQIETF